MCRVCGVILVLVCCFM